jgi:hypothetical protein
MKIINITNDTSVNVNGTGLQGYVNTTYADIVAAFGEPTYTHGDKTNVEWNLEFVIKLQDAPGSFIEEVVVATIYDWKRPSIPMGEYDWHIGGFSTQVIECVYSLLQEKVL